MGSVHKIFHLGEMDKRDIREIIFQTRHILSACSVASSSTSSWKLRPSLRYAMKSTIETQHLDVGRQKKALFNEAALALVEKSPSSWNRRFYLSKSSIRRFVTHHSEA